MSDQTPVKEPQCKICGALYSAHTAGACPWCGLLREHHQLPGGGGGKTEGTVEDCRAGKARMAAARRPEDRDDVDRAALAGAAT